MQLTGNGLTTQGCPLTKRPDLGPRTISRNQIWLTTAGRRGDIVTATASELQRTPIQAELGVLDVCRQQQRLLDPRERTCRLHYGPARTTRLPALASGACSATAANFELCAPCRSSRQSSLPLLLACLLGVLTNILRFQGQVLLSSLAHCGSSVRRRGGRGASCWVSMRCIFNSQVLTRGMVLQGYRCAAAPHSQPKPASAPCSHIRG